jgi:hypothetical protein
MQYPRQAIPGHACGLSVPCQDALAQTRLVSGSPCFRSDGTVCIASSAVANVVGDGRLSRTVTTHVPTLLATLAQPERSR